MSGGMTHKSQRRAGERKERLDEPLRSWCLCVRWSRVRVMMHAECSNGDEVGLGRAVVHHERYHSATHGGGGGVAAQQARRWMRALHVCVCAEFATCG